MAVYNSRQIKINLEVSNLLKLTKLVGTFRIKRLNDVHYVDEQL